MTAAEPVPPEMLPEDEVAGRWVCFELDGSRYAVEILRVIEVLAEVEIEPVPGAAAGVLGVCNLRGRIITVFNPRAALRVDLGPVESSGTLIVVDLAGEPIGLRVDRVDNVRALRARQLTRLQGDDRGTPVSAHVIDDGPELRLLDVDRLLASLAADEPLRR